MLTAIREFVDNKNMRVAFILAGVALELRLREIVFHMLKVHHGLSASEAEVAIEERYAGPKRKLEFVSSTLNKLGKKPVDPSLIDDWNKKMYKLRNRVAHEGYTPSEEDTKAAIKSTCMLMDDLERVLSGLSYHLMDYGKWLCTNLLQ